MMMTMTLGEQEKFSKLSSMAEIPLKERTLRRFPAKRYSGPFLKWTMEKPEKINQKTRKLMMMLLDEIKKLCVKKGRKRIRQH